MQQQTHHRLVTCAAVTAVLCATLLAATAVAQNAPPPGLGVQSPPPQSAPQPPPPDEQPAREETPGLINELGKLWDALPKIKSPSETLDDIRGAGESLGNLARPGIMVTGRSACVVAANGAPDCKAGADRLCQSKGYKEGKSLDVNSSEKCSPKVYIPGRKREPGDCKTENYVIKALCQQ